ncbi:MAG TPA: HlyD family efflux transporter periplasmic adaptor subunit [Propionibacteriaceae bacterium]|jgi:multidrug resistance efflux pump|nr:HlyD family efflux transporter periplasmic adaptor subunit [Propionibacteriaceae bacterium]
MTWTNRFRLLAGLLTVITLVAALTLVFNQRQTRAASLTATISADTYLVGAAYGGTVIEQHVRDGDTVESGQELFTILSVGLQQDLANGLKIQSSEAYDVDTKKGTVTYKATVPGQVSELAARLGNALATNQPFAKITVVDSQFVEARYLLTPRDYERVTEGARASILLPNNQTIDGQVSSIEVATDEGQARAKVRVDSPDLTQDDLGDLTKPGTPVTATIELRDDGPLAGVSDLAAAMVRQVGLA